MPGQYIDRPTSPERLDGLDTLRSAAIVLVFMYHYMVFVSRAPTFGWGSEVGWVGVDLFFVLSGYLIANQIFAGVAKGRVLSLRAFYIRRFLRTLPNFYVVLALYLLLPGVMGGTSPPPLWTFLSFTQNILLQPGTAFSHAWSLCIEEQFYLLLPAVVLLSLRTGMSIRLGWALLGLLMLAGIITRSALWLKFGREADGAIGGYHPHIYYASWCRFDEFLPGVALAMLKNFHPAVWHRLAQRGRTSFVAGSTGMVLVFAAVLAFYEIDGYGYGYFMTGFGYSLLAIVFAVLTLSALSPDSPLHRIRVPGAAQLAAWSYAIYLTHKPIAHILQRPLAATGIDAGSPTAVAAVACVCLLAGYLLYRLVETPFMRLRDRWVSSSFRGAVSIAPGTAGAPA